MHILVFSLRNFFLLVLLASSLEAMEKHSTSTSAKEKEYDEQQALALAKYSLQHVGRSARNNELYRDLLYTAAKNHYHTLEDVILTKLKGHLNNRNFAPIINKSFFAAASGGNTEFLEKILKENLTNKAKSHALHLGARNGNMDVVKLMLNHGACANFIPKHAHGESVLAVAIKNDREPIVQLLLERKVNPNGPAPHSFTDLLTWVSTMTHGLKYLKLLLDYGADPNGKPKPYLKPLMFAALHNHHSFIEMLLSYGANADLQMPESKNTALIQAAKYAHVESVELLSSDVPSKLTDQVMQEVKTDAWKDSYLQMLVPDLRKEVSRMRTVPACNPQLTDKTGKTALEIARAFEIKATGEKKSRYQKIIKILEPITPKISLSIMQSGQ